VSGCDDRPKISSAPIFSYAERVARNSGFLPAFILDLFVDLSTLLLPELEGENYPYLPGGNASCPGDDRPGVCSGVTSKATALTEQALSQLDAGSCCYIHFCPMRRASSTSRRISRPPVARGWSGIHLLHESVYVMHLTSKSGDIPWS
jgi:hypothetical protein